MIYDPRSLDSWCISGSDESLFGWVLSVNHDPRDPVKWILIRIILKERTIKSFRWSLEGSRMTFTHSIRC